MDPLVVYLEIGWHKILVFLPLMLQELGSGSVLLMTKLTVVWLRGYGSNRGRIGRRIRSGFIAQRHGKLRSRMILQDVHLAFRTTLVNLNEKKKGFKRDGNCKTIALLFIPTRILFSPRLFLN